MADAPEATPQNSWDDDELFAELHRLITARSDDSITDEELALLDKIVCEQPRAAELFARYMLQTASLQAWAWGTSTPPANEAEATVVVRRTIAAAALRQLNPWRHPINFAGTTLALTLLAWLGVLLLISPASRLRAPGQPGEANIVAELSNSHDAIWALGQRSTNHGDALVGGQNLQLTSGLAEITFVTGARVVLEGHCGFTVEDKLGGTLKFGKLAARVDTEKAQGFMITTPAATIVDLGTEFGVNVAADGGSEVNVFDGKVRLTDRREKFIADVVQGEQLFVSPLGQIMPASPASHFVRAVPVGGSRLKGTNVAYHIIRGAQGNQAYGGALGHDFVVNKPIEILALGVFDDGANGLQRTITGELWRRDDNGTPDNFADDQGSELLASQEFAPNSPGSLAGSSRFKVLDKPLALPPGSYTMVAHGYGANELASNQGGQLQSPFKRTNGAEGAISFVGTSRYGDNVGQFPTTADRAHNPTQYCAGTFSFRVKSSETELPITSTKN